MTHLPVLPATGKIPFFCTNKTSVVQIINERSLERSWRHEDAYLELLAQTVLPLEQCIPVLPAAARGCSPSAQPHSTSQHNPSPNPSLAHAHQLIKAIPIHYRLQQAISLSKIMRWRKVIKRIKAEPTSQK